METVLRSPFRARVRELPVSVGSQVETGAALLRLEPLADEGEEAEAAGTGAAAEIDLPAEPADASAASRAERGLQDLRSLLLGFDVDPHDQRRTLAGYLAARAELGESSRPLAAEVELLQVFADLAELTRNRPAGEDISAGHRCTAPASTSTPTCRASTWSGPGCRRRSRAGCGAVLGHYGVASLDRTPELEEAVFRIFLAQQRASADVAVVSALLRQWLTEAPPAGVAARGGRPGAGAPGGRHAGALPVGGRPGPRRGVPLVRPAAAAPGPRAEVYAEVRQNLRHLDRNPDSPDRAERIAAMVAGSEPLVRLLGQRHRPARHRPGAAAGGADPPLLRQQGPVGRPLARRRGLHVRHRRARGAGPAWSPPPSTSAQLADAVRAVGELAADAPAGAHVVADIYVRLGRPAGRWTRWPPASAR